MIILGVDPGLAATGYGIIKKDGGNLALVDYGVIATPAGMELSARLKFIADDFKSLLEKYRPAAVAAEKLFFAKNAKTAMDVGHSRGIILLRTMEAGARIFEFTPLQVKQAVSGYGAADKAQVQKMVQTILKLKELPRPDDAADALAIAITLAHSINLIEKRNL